MAMQEASGFCRACNRQVLVRRRGVNHLLHLVLSILTAGVWLFVWMWVYLGSVLGRWRCSQCGLRASRDWLR